MNRREFSNVVIIHAAAKIIKYHMIREDSRSGRRIA
jgi:hypothetical protein